MSRYNPNDVSLDTAVDSQFVSSCVILNPGRQLNMLSGSDAMSSCQYGLVTRKHYARSFSAQDSCDYGIQWHEPGIEEQAYLHK